MYHNEVKYLNVEENLFLEENKMIPIKLKIFGVYLNGIKLSLINAPKNKPKLTLTETEKSGRVSLK
jgi:hypothetical protein